MKIDVPTGDIMVPNNNDVISFYFMGINFNLSEDFWSDKRACVIF